MIRGPAHAREIARELLLSESAIRATVGLLDDLATVPFIARYRKEATGGLDEVAIIAVRDRTNELRARDTRREAILASLEERSILTPQLEQRIGKAATRTELEDIYLPYRPARRTRAAVARERGLEPLAARILRQHDFDIVSEAHRFVDVEKDVPSADAALRGARDIIAETINQDGEVRLRMRRLYFRRAVLRSKVVRSREESALNYRDYFDFSERASNVPSHRMLAIIRGAAEGLLTYHIRPEEAQAVVLVERLVVRMRNQAAEQVRQAIADCYKRLLAPAMETELRAAMLLHAQKDAIAVFAQNLRDLLLAPAAGPKRVLAVDPGLRTGCKIVCLDRQGALLEADTIYPLAPHRKTDEASDTIRRLCRHHAIEIICVGNGTGGREARSFCEELELEEDIPVVTVNESGASVYSASEAARREFPDHDTTVRGVVSIGRRLMDPLAELVKIDPKSIGVGQYQHDVDQKLLKMALDDVVQSCVSAVGVEVNTASPALLRYVAGLSEQTARELVAARTACGPFRTRSQLLSVPGVGPKTFQQAAGFLRIRDGEHPLDASAVHPERYPVVEKMATQLGVPVSELLRSPGLENRLDLAAYVTDELGLPTLTDILAELAKPGRDPRPAFETFRFAEAVRGIEDLRPCMRIPGVITNVTAFGAFVDVGVHQDGLIHISQMADRFIKNPLDVVKVGQKVEVEVLSVDRERKRISLSMKQLR